MLEDVVKTYHFESLRAEHGYSSSFLEVLQFLIGKNEDFQYLYFHWSRWEWMFARDNYKVQDLPQMKLIYDHQQLVGVILFEDQPNLFFLLYNNELSLKKTIATYMVTALSQHNVMIPNDAEMRDLLVQNGYRPTSQVDPIARFNLTHFEVHIPEGYQIIPLADEPDMKKVHYVLWRGFNHGDDIVYDDQTLRERDAMFSSPHFNRQWSHVAKYGDEFVCFVGIWYLPGTKTALLEPVATVPEHRKKGLAKACIYHCIRAVQSAGATDIFVGSNQVMYQKIGFVAYDEMTGYSHDTMETSSSLEKEIL